VHNVLKNRAEGRLDRVAASPGNRDRAGQRRRPVPATSVLIVRKVIEYRRCSTAGMLCCQIAAHHVERTRFGGERETPPFVAVGTVKPIPRMGAAPSL